MTWLTYGFLALVILTTHIKQQQGNVEIENALVPIFIIALGPISLFRVLLIIMGDLE